MTDESGDGSTTGGPGDRRRAGAPRGAGRAARTIAYLDLAEGRGPVPVLDDDGDRRASCGRTRRIAVVGASSNEARPSFGVFRYLVHQGYDCVPVNPAERDGPRRPGVPDARARPSDATGPFDIVDVFRRSELCVAARPRGGRDRGALPLAPARRRQLGGGADRPRRRAGGRDGSLHGDRAPPDPGR